MSERCCIDPGAPQSHHAVGTEEIIAGLNTYKTGSGQSVIVIFTDVFGYTFVNTRKIADTFAETVGTTVLIPDFFDGDPLDSTAKNLSEQMPLWREKHPVEQACISAANFISTIKDHYESIQIIGFCYGAKSVVHLITHVELSSTIKSAAVAHPTFLVEEEASQIKRPILFMCAETDQRFLPDLRQYYEKILAPTGLATFIDYPGTVHGFVIRPSDSPQVNEQRDKAVSDAIAFFKKNL